MNKPFLLRPVPKDYLWGGTRLNDDFNKGFVVDPIAESWECSTHPDGVSYADIGYMQEMDSSLIDSVDNSHSATTLLSDVLSTNPEYLGTHPLQLTDGEPELPILIKFIDAKKDLSIQVHPDDEYAMRMEQSLGKTEMWYVVEARRGAHVVYGFRQDMDQSSVRKSIQNGRIGCYVNHVPVHKNDLFFIEAGTVHAIGAGCLIAEIQENSNITYRLYDYDRVDRNGNKRELHIDKALEVANLKSSATPRQPMRVMRYRKGCATELLSRCKYFQVERMLLNTEVHRELVEYRTRANSFHVLLCVDGCGSISVEEPGEDIGSIGNDTEEGKTAENTRNCGMMNFFKGDCIFVPAESELLKLHGRAQILDVSC